MNQDLQDFIKYDKKRGNLNWKIILSTIIITALIVSGGVYYYRQVSKNSSVIKEGASCEMQVTDKKINIVEDFKISDLLKEIFSLDYSAVNRSFDEIISIGEKEYFTKGVQHIDWINNIVWNGEYWMIQGPELSASLAEGLSASEIIGAYKYDGGSPINLINEKPSKEFFWNGDYWLLSNGFKYDGEGFDRIDALINSVGEFISADYNGEYWLLGTENGKLYRYNDKDNSIIDLSDQLKNNFNIPVSYIVSLGKNWLISGFYCETSGCFGGYKYDGEKIEELYSKSGNIWIARFGDDRVLVTDNHSVLWEFSDCNIVELHRSFENQYIDMVSCLDEYCLILTRDEKSGNKNLYEYNGEELKLLNNLFSREDINKFSYIYIGSNNWIIEAQNKTYAYQGGSLMDISVNLGNRFVDNAVWNGKYWLISIGSRKILKYTPGFSSVDIKERDIIKGNGENIYLIENGKKRLILNEYILNEQGYNWFDIINVSDSRLESYPDGNIIAFKDGSILKHGTEAYIIEDGKRREILGGLYGKVFEYLELDVTTALTVYSDELLLIPEGIPYSEYRISGDIVCSKRLRNDFDKYSWFNALLDSDPLLGFTGQESSLSDVCYNPTRNEIIYFNEGEAIESEPGVYKSVRTSNIISFNTLTLQTTQLLERETSGFLSCGLTGWEGDKLEYCCGGDWYGYEGECYLFDIEAKINVLKE